MLRPRAPLAVGRPSAGAAGGVPPRRTTSRPSSPCIVTYRTSSCVAASAARWRSVTLSYARMPTTVSRVMNCAIVRARSMSPARICDTWRVTRTADSAIETRTIVTTGTSTSASGEACAGRGGAASAAIALAIALEPAPDGLVEARALGRERLAERPGAGERTFRSASLQRRGHRLRGLAADGAERAVQLVGGRSHTRGVALGQRRVQLVHDGRRLPPEDRHEPVEELGVAADAIERGLDVEHERQRAGRRGRRRRGLVTARPVARAGHEASQAGGQLGPADRLRQVVVHANRRAPIALVGDGA